MPWMPLPGLGISWTICKSSLCASADGKESFVRISPQVFRYYEITQAYVLIMMITITKIT